MDCKTLQDAWQAYLRGDVADETRRRIELHLGECEPCQGMPVVEERLSNLLRERLPREKAPASLRGRILSDVGSAASANVEPAAVAAPVRGAGHAEPAAGSWIQRLLGSPWGPRLATAAIVLFVVLVPVRMLFRAPALAVEAVERHERHLEAASSGPLSCCRPLALRPGDTLGDPSEGVLVPDLEADGLEFVMAGRCNDQGTEVTILAYRSQADESFSLYITDRARDNFRAVRSKEVGGFQQVRNQVHRSEVTIWERDGLVWFWIGPRSNPEYSTALADLRTL